MARERGIYRHHTATWKHLRLNINPQHGIEDIILQGGEDYQLVIIREEDSASAFAREVSENPGNLFTNGSRIKNGYRRCAVAWKFDNQWSF
jgi:thiamine monophosphate kinase